MYPGLQYYGFIDYKNRASCAYTLWLTYAPWWRHQMEKFAALLAICAGNSPVLGEFPAQRPGTRALMFLICAWINTWVKNRGAGDLRCYGAHCDVTVMTNVNYCHSFHVSAKAKVIIWNHWLRRKLSGVKHGMDRSETAPDSHIYP